MPHIKIKKNTENPESAELLAANIIKVAEGFEKLLNTPLNQRAIEALLRDYIGTTKITKKQLRLVLQALPRLKSWYVK
jgi:hypothetical protein